MDGRTPSRQSAGASEGTGPGMKPERENTTLLSSIARTPPNGPNGLGQRAVSAEPSSAARHFAIHTPGQLAREGRGVSVPHRTPTAQIGRSLPGSGSGLGPSSGTGRRREADGLDASARHLRTSVNKATPHARKAIEVLKGRRTAIFNTPGRAARDARRRTSHADQQDAPFDALRHLSRRLAPATQRVVTSSSPGSGAGRDSLTSDPRRRFSSGGGAEVESEDDDSGLLMRRPRLSLPLDYDDGDGELRRPRTSGLEDTVMSVERPRRAISEQPWNRSDRESLRMSDVFGQPDFTGEINFEDEGMLPLPFDLGAGDESEQRDDDFTLERLDSSPGRREPLAAGRQSDFGTIEVPVDVDSPFRFDPQLPEDSIEVPELEFDDGSPTTSPLGLPIPGREAAEAVNRDEEELEEHAGAAAAFDDDYSAVDPAGGEQFDEGVLDSDDNVDVDVDIMEEEAADADIAAAATTAAAENESTKTRKKRSATAKKFGVNDPCLPASVVKRLAQTLATTSGVRNPKISQHTLRQMMLATDWFFEQLGGDLAAYAHHAGRKTIENVDVTLLMSRQRQTSSQATLFSLAQRHLPRELLQELRMPPKSSPKKRRKTGRAAAEAEDGS